MTLDVLLGIIAGLIPLIAVYINAQLSKKEATKSHIGEIDKIQVSTEGPNSAEIEDQALKELKGQINGKPTEGAKP